MIYILVATKSKKASAVSLRLSDYRELTSKLPMIPLCKEDYDGNYLFTN